jgi:hypothetical protein
MLACLLVLLVQPQPVPARTPPESSLNPVSYVVKTFIQLANDVLDKGNALWETIGGSQAVTTTQEVASQSASLEILKVKLRQDILDNKIQSEDELRTRVTEIVKKVKDLSKPLDKFAVEIDGAGLNVGVDFRTAVSEMAYGKIEDLEEVMQIWRRNAPESHRQAAMKLDLAIKCLHEMQNAATCLANTVRDKHRDERPSCSHESIQADCDKCAK